MRCLALLFCALLAVAAAAAPNGTARNKTAHIQKAHSSAADSADDNDNMTAPPAERGDDAGADALVTGVTAFDADSLISDKLARSVNETNITLVYLAHFTRMCSASCDSDNTTANQPLVAGRRMLELCDDCWCRQNRPCTVSPPYELCITCMDTWSACAPSSKFDVNANTTIRPLCEAKKPVPLDVAISANNKTSGVVTDGVFAGGAGR